MNGCEAGSLLLGLATLPLSYWLYVTWCVPVGLALYVLHTKPIETRTRGDRRIVTIGGLVLLVSVVGFVWWVGVL